MTAVHRLHHHRAAIPAMMSVMDDGSQQRSTTSRAGGKVLVLPPAARERADLYKVTYKEPVPMPRRLTAAAQSLLPTWR